MRSYPAFAIFCFATSVAPAFATRVVLSKRQEGEVVEGVAKGADHLKHAASVNWKHVGAGGAGGILAGYGIFGHHRGHQGSNGNGNGNQKREISVAYDL
ncbi:hypothetical protein F5148DRAFT_1177436, partial [Russula earlei]